MSVYVCGWIRPKAYKNPEHSPCALRAQGHINMFGLPLHRKCKRSKVCTPLNVSIGASAKDGRVFSARPIYMSAFRPCRLCQAFRPSIYVYFASQNRHQSTKARQEASPVRAIEIRTQSTVTRSLSVCGAVLFLRSDGPHWACGVFGGVSEGASPFMLVAPSGLKN